MPLICYHASHEQFAPSHLLRLVTLAEAAGFDGVHSSDHFHPWSERQGHSGFTFSWIAAALQATNIPFSMICTPGQRYHPAVTAQAIATLCEMFPGRVGFEMGSGEALNEIITGDDWPEKAQRNERLLQSVQVIRQLLQGREVNAHDLVKVSNAKLYTLPTVQPLLLCAAMSARTAAWAGSWADGLLTTVEKDFDKTKEKVDAFRQNGGGEKPIYLQLGCSYGRVRKQAQEGLFDQWRSNILPREKLESFRAVKDFDNAATAVTMQEVLEAIPVYTDMEALWEKIHSLEALQPERIVIHNINRQQEQFIEDFQHTLVFRS